MDKSEDVAVGNDRIEGAKFTAMNKSNQTPQTSFSADWVARENGRTSAWFNQPEQMQMRQILADQLQQISTAQAKAGKKPEESAGWERWVAETSLDPQTDLEQRQLRRRSAQNDVLEEGECLREVYPTGIAWLPNRYGFFYDRYLSFPGGHGLYFHLVGTEQGADVCVYYNAAEPNWYYQPFVSPNARWLLLSILHKGANNRLTLFPLSDRGETLVGQAIDIIATFRGRYDPLHWVANQLLLRALEPTLPNGRLIALDLAEPYSSSTILMPPESYLLQALDQLHITRLVIAHRLSSIRNADQILVLDNGRLIENGPPNELLAKDGLYRHLVREQAVQD